MKQEKTFSSGIGFHRKAVLSTVSMCTKQIFDGGLLCVTGGYMVQAAQFVMLIFIWKSLAESGALPEDTPLDQLMTYTLMSTIFHQEFNIISPATASLWEGSIISRFLRPMPVEVSFMAETVGRWWIPSFLFFGLPLWLLSPALGIRPWPVTAGAGLLALFSLMLAASLGFAIDLIFAALAMYLKNGCWAALAVREAIYSLLSGEMIPFSLFPFGIGTIFSLLPLGSVAHGPLTIYTDSACSPWSILGLQIFWNIILWTAAVRIFRKSKERMISFGG
ncbi:hypothetical protein AALB39_26975 [Lachnospiraceae bacterium 54-53]